MHHFINELMTIKTSDSFISACPLTLGLEDGRIKDEQVSASSELDNKHTANQGRVSHKTDKNRLNRYSLLFVIFSNECEHSNEN